MAWPKFDLDAFARDVDPKVLRRIGSYGPDRIHLLGMERERVFAHVLGSDGDVYCVEVEQDGDDLIALCTCPHFTGGQRCKHIGAVMALVNEPHRARPNPLADLRARLEAEDRQALVERIMKLAVLGPQSFATLTERLPPWEGDDYEEVES
jgi:uncharacterized Zn finger protein